MEEHPGWGDIQRILAIGMCFGFLGIVLLWMFFPPKGNEATNAVLNTLVGAAAAGFSMVLQYYFGSSKTSGTKDDTIARLTQPQNGTSTTTTTTSTERK